MRHIPTSEKTETDITEKNHKAKNRGKNNKAYSVVDIIKRNFIYMDEDILIHRIHRIHRRQHAFTDDTGMSKHRLSPYNAYYHNWHTLNFTTSDSSSDRCFLKVLIVLHLTQLALQWCAYMMNLQIQFGAMASGPTSRDSLYHGLYHSSGIFDPSTSR